MTSEGRRASGRHRRPVLVPERWWWFVLVSVPAWGQVAAWPFLRHDRHAYNVGVAVPFLLFAVYLWYFVVNRRRHARLRRAGARPQEAEDQAS